MTCTSDFSAPMQFQNPAISGDPNGWSNCAAYVGAYAASYSSCGLIHPTGATVRAYTTEPVPDPNSPGLTITQVAGALARLGVTVYPFVRMPWSQVEAFIDGGRYVSLCGQYSVIRPTKFSGDPNFYGGHQIGVPPGFEVQDPLTDGRRAGIYRYHQEPYPRDLVRRFAGAFRVRINGVTQPIGLGWAQGFYTDSHPSPVFPPPPQPPQESAVRVTSPVYQHWSAVGTNGVLRATPARSAPILAMVPAGTIVQSRAEADDPSGNHWRLIEWPAGSKQPGWLLHYGPGVPRGHDWMPTDQPTDTP